MALRKNGQNKGGGSAAKHDAVRALKNAYRDRQKGTSTEERIRQLYAMQERYLAVSRAAIKSGFKKPSDEFIRACKLMGR